MTRHIPRILVMDDELPVRSFLQEALQDSCDHLCLAADLPQALTCSARHSHDVILADICMPGHTGTELLQIAHHLHWDCAVILMTGNANLQEIASGIRFRPTDFLLKPFSLEALTQAVQQSYDKLLKDRQNQSERQALSSDLLKRSEQLAQARQGLRESYRSALECLIATLEAREFQTYTHSFRVRAYAVHLAMLMNYPAASLPRLAYAALLHDIGKIAVSDSILLKPAALNAEEFETMKRHAVVGERIVRHMNFLDGADIVIRHHHESWDGSGYPDGLRGKAIPFGSRLFAVADTLDAMTSDRCYRQRLEIADARAEITRCSGTQFDPAVVEVAAAIPDDVWKRLCEQADSDARAAMEPQLIAAVLPCIPVLDQLSPTIP